MTGTIDVRGLFAEAAWNAAMDNLAENECELEDAVDRYSDETGEEIAFAPSKRHERGGELSDPAFEAWYRARVAERARDLADGYEKMTRRGRIRAWRAVMAPPGWDARAAHAGEHWSSTREKAQPIFGDADEGRVLHVVEALLPVASIDWPATLRANLGTEFGEDEDEIRLLEDAPYAVVRVRRPHARNTRKAASATGQRSGNSAGTTATPTEEAE